MWKKHGILHGKKKNYFPQKYVIVHTVISAFYRYVLVKT